MEKSVVPTAYKEYSPEKPHNSRNAPIILLHGVTNAKETWDDCAQEIADRTASKVYSLDARNHGDSGWIDTMGYDLMAKDILCFMDSKAIPKVIIVGHSMGGKTGMSFALNYPNRLESLIIEDISIHSSSSSRTVVNYYMKQLKDVLTKIPPDAGLIDAKRFAASYLSGGEAAAKKKLLENSVAPKIWDGKYLPLKKTSDGGFQWKTNLDVIMDAMENGKWKPVSYTGLYEGPVLIIYGTKSPFKVLDDKVEFLKLFPRTLYEPIQDGSHSLHDEYPEIFIDLVCDFILKQRASSTNKKCMVA